MRPGSPVLVRITRDTVERGDVEKVLALFRDFVPAKLDTLRNRIVFHVSGYDGDERELYGIGEVRDFFGRLFDAVPGIFHWLEVSDEGLLFAALMVCTPLREEGGVRVAGEELEGFLADGLRGLQAFSEDHDIDPQPTVRAVAGLIRKKIGQ